ncbi:hypothetical protein V6N13_033757 [Hibiscus sabdariffa]|uniref:Uncharacterized protein n=1 Tax=Hibiscus sabdariffa TaxID=183260 RepID=A0ABR2F9L5_9ROSI
MEVGQVKGNFVDEKYHIRVKMKFLQAVLEECRRAVESLSNCKDGTDDDDEDDADKDAVNPQVEVRDVDTLRDEEVVEVETKQYWAVPMAIVGISMVVGFIA